MTIIFKPRAVNTVMTRHGKLDILLNNAGVATRCQNLTLYSDDDWPSNYQYKILFRNHPNDPPEHLDVAEMTNVFATNVGGSCAATQVILKFSSISSFLIDMIRLSCLCYENPLYLALSASHLSLEASQGEYFMKYFISSSYLYSFILYWTWSIFQFSFHGMGPHINFQKPSEWVELLHGDVIPLFKVSLEPAHQVFLPWHSWGGPNFSVQDMIKIFHLWYEHRRAKYLLACLHLFPGGLSVC